MYRKGFALLEILIVVAVLVLVAGGGFYLNSLRNDAATVKTGISAEQQAKEVVQQSASATEAEQEALGQLASPGQNPATISTSATVGVTVPGQTTADPLAGLGSDKYADGELPLGDGKYVTNSPKKGYVYLCNANLNGGGGAEENGPWIGTDTWNIDQKVSVQGSVTWPNASFSMSVEGTTRVITSNDLPNGIPTGIFPIQPTDPAYQYDTNPNSIKTQSLSFSFPANPTFAAAPSCIGGEVGVMTDGVMLFDAFDENLRDAPAHELQDKCNGHPQEAGEYHYHGPSACLPNASTTVIGFAFDGFPITGAKISDGRYLTTADLDECHGITSPIVLDGKSVTMYHYVMTEDFPYSVSCFRGTPTVKGPTVPPSGGSSQNAGSGQGNDTPPQPPAQAIAACAGQSSGASCSFSGQQGTISGSCETPPGQSSLACVPAGR